MRRKLLFLVAALAALTASLFDTFRVGHHMVQRATEQDRKRERIRQLDDRLQRLARATERISIARQDGMIQPSAAAVKTLGIARERARITIKRDKLQKELSDAVPPLF
ncbi:MAG TPA: hypothetical protein VFG04_18455 [Planctomycetaceae bacterium]|jgi:hypothetical protein|nr:hypothetical protein [Planctomycetaceae bacterium]